MGDVRWHMTWVRLGEAFELPGTAVIVQEELVWYDGDYGMQVVWRDDA